MEEVLRTHRDQALKILQENGAQSREGIELLVRSRLETLAATIRQGGASVTPEQMEALYGEILDLSYTIFSLGYTMAHTISREPAAKR